MKQNLIILAILLITSGCRNPSRSDNSIDLVSNIDIANNFIHAFYSFDRDRLASILSYAKESQPGILYYQKWAEYGSYEIVQKNVFIERNDSMMLCSIAVEDDLMGALSIDFNVTDAFHLTIIDGHIRSVQTSSNDPEMYYEAKEWVKNNLPELIEGPCKGIWEGGPTPCECVRAMVEGYKRYMENRLLPHPVQY
jgi:hypothetical protein